ncbi:unnamed protein product [Caenorhabditis brenneri]
MYAPPPYGFPPPPGIVQYLAPQVQPPPPTQQFVITICFDTRENLIGVRRPNGIYYMYSYDCVENKMIRHACHCQPAVREQDLTPLYADWNDTKQILFCFNNLSSRVETYVYDFESDTFEQLEDPAVVYNPTLVKPPYSTIAVLRGAADQQIRISKDQNGFMTKEMLGARHAYPLRPSEVRTSVGRAAANYRRERVLPNHPIDVDSDADFLNYMNSIAPFIVRHCSQTRQDTVTAFNYRTENYVRFYFDAQAGEFCFSHCDCCLSQTRERDLIPKYTELSPDRTKTVLHVQNTFTGAMEKYCFNYKVYGFEQVKYPELVYDGSRTTQVTTLMVVPESRITITRNQIDGRLRVEQYCPIEQKYKIMNEVPVRTFLVQRKEEERRLRGVEERAGGEDDQEEDQEQEDEQLSDESMDSESDEEEDAAQDEAAPPQIFHVAREQLFDSDGSDSEASESTEQEFD